MREEQIPELIRQGKDREVISLLYKKVLPLVKRFVVKHSGRKEDANDVFQDALMVFYKQVIKGTFDPKYKVYGYLYRLSINYWINKIKKDSRMQLVDEMGSFEKEEMSDQREELVAGGDENLLHSLFSAIGEKCIELLNYTIYSQLLMEDIMVRMNFPSVSAVKMQQQRCKKKLIEEIEKNPALADKLRRG